MESGIEETLAYYAFPEEHYQDAVFRWCVDRDMIAVSPFMKVKKPAKHGSRARVLSVAVTRHGKVPRRIASWNDVTERRTRHK